MDWLALIVGGIAASSRHSPLRRMRGGDPSAEASCATGRQDILEDQSSGALGLSGPHGAWLNGISNRDIALQFLRPSFQVGWYGRRWRTQVGTGSSS
jgi:hypothetical protein